MNDTLTEMKNNLQGINRTDEVEEQVSSLEDKEVENAQWEQQKEKNLKKWEYCKELLGQLQVYQHLHHGGVGNRRERARNWTPIWKKMIEKFSNLVKEIDIQVQEAQSPKQDEPKEDHTKTFHN